MRYYKLQTRTIRKEKKEGHLLKQTSFHIPPVIERSRNERSRNDPGNNFEK